MATHSSLPPGKIPWTEDLLCYVHVAAESRAGLSEKADTHPMATKYTKRHSRLFTKEKKSETIML